MLGLARRKDKRAERSDVEWLKHLATDGFHFPKQRDPSYCLGFLAGPSHPAVEHDIRKFLDVIEREFAQCKGLLPFLEDRWRSFILPGEINREYIKSNGYSYGEYRFLLDQTQVPNLLMGENLYEDRHVFVANCSRTPSTPRVIASSPSASRVTPTTKPSRSASRSGGTRKAACGSALTISAWGWTSRSSGTTCCGSGRRTTRRGSSGPMSSGSKRGAPDFVPISRFGIGLLSCFIIADRVEISTRHLGTEVRPADPVRLSLDGLHGFYTLQTGRVQGSPMPGEDGDDPGYRWEIGTSIAVRLDPRKEGATFQLRSLLEKHVFSSPVPIELDGQPVGHDYASMIEKPWCEPTVVDFLPEGMVSSANSRATSSPSP